MAYKIYDLRLLDPILLELENYRNVSASSGSKAFGILAIPEDMGRIINKTFRYLAVMYGLKAFYIVSKGHRVLIICYSEKFLKDEYRMEYNRTYLKTFEDSERVDYAYLHRSMMENVKNFNQTLVRLEIGLPVEDNLSNKEGNLEEENGGDSQSTQQGSDGSFNCGKVGKLAREIYQEQREFLAKVLRRQSPTYATSSENENIRNESLLEIFESVREHLPAEFVEVFGKVSRDDSQISSTSFQQVDSKISDQRVNLSFEPATIQKYFIGTPTILPLIKDYNRFDYIKKCDLDNVVEIYDIPFSFTSNCLNNVYRIEPSRIIRFSDTRAFIVTVCADDASKILMHKTALCKARRMIFASPVATVVASLLDFCTIRKNILKNSNGNNI